MNLYAFDSMIHAVLQINSKQQTRNLEEINLQGIHLIVFLILGYLTE